MAFKAIFFLQIWIVTFFPFCHDLIAQQILVPASDPYQQLLFERNFKGIIRLTFTKIGDYKLKKDIVYDPYDEEYISNEKGLFIKGDSTFFNLSDLFEGLQYQLQGFDNTNSLVDITGRVYKIFDTLYKFNTDSFYEKRIFYPNENFFVQRFKKNNQAFFDYMIAQYDSENALKFKSYYRFKKNVADDSVRNYLDTSRFSEFTEFTYSYVKAQNKIASIKVYRCKKKKIKKYLYASNKYTYRDDGRVTKMIFTKYNQRVKIVINVNYDYLQNLTSLKSGTAQ